MSKPQHSEKRLGGKQPPQLKAANAARDANAEINRKKAFHLRSLGLTYRQIAERLGVRVRAAWEYVNAGWGEVVAEVEDTRRVLKEQELEILGTLQEKWLPIASSELLNVESVVDGPNGPRTIEVADFEAGTKAAAIVLKVQERRAKLLGLDEADKVEHSGEVKHLTLAEFEERCRKVGL